jgi:hypothetical protein
VRSTADQRIGALLDRVRTVAALGVSITFEHSAGPEPHTPLAQLLIEVGRHARHLGKAVILHIDEVQNITNNSALSQLLIALGDTLAFAEPVRMPGGIDIATSVPVAIYLTGLPEFIDLAGAKHGATFARRFQTTTLAPLSDDDLDMALRPFVIGGIEVLDATNTPCTVTMTPDAAGSLIDRCKGEPFLFQLAGARAWLAGETSTITSSDVARGWETLHDEATHHVARILDRLPDKERAFLDAMAALDPASRTLTAIASALGYSAVTQVGTIGQRLETTRKIVSRGRPYTFLNRAIESYLTSTWPNV